MTDKAPLVLNEQKLESEMTISNDDRIFLCRHHINVMGFKFLQHLESENISENVFLSPFSLFVALWLVNKAANEATWKSFCHMIETDIAPKARQLLTLILQDIIKQLSCSEKTEFVCANSMWYKGEDVSVVPDYSKWLQENFSAQIFNTAKDGDMDNWVDKATNGKITKMPEIKLDTKLVMLNAIYFKGQFKIPFKKEDTIDQPFSISQTETKTVPMMKMMNTVPYFENDRVQTVVLPFYGDCELILFLSKDPTKPLDMQLEFDKMDLKNVKGEISIPRFKIDLCTSLMNTMKAWGYCKTEDENTFDSMCVSKLMEISEVNHSTMFEVNEDGALSSACTQVQMRCKSLHFVDGPKFHFNANRPFGIMITSLKIKLALFAGKIAKPF